MFNSECQTGVFIYHKRMLPVPDLPEHIIAAYLQVLPVHNGEMEVLVLTGSRHPIQVPE